MWTVYLTVVKLRPTFSVENNKFMPDPWIQVIIQLHLSKNWNHEKLSPFQKVLLLYALELLVLFPLYDKALQEIKPQFVLLLNP